MSGFRSQYTVRATAWVVLFVLTSVVHGQEAALETLARDGHWKRVREQLQRDQPLGSEAAKAYWQARVKHAFGDLEAAEVLAKRAVSLDASKAAYHYALASIYLDELEKHPGMFRAMHLAHETKSELESAVALDPKHVDGLFMLMAFEWHAPGIAGGNHEKARELANRIGEIEPARGFLAQAELKDSENSDVGSLLEKAAEAAPRDYTMRVRLAEYFYNSAKDYPRAEQEAKTAVALSKDRIRAYADLSILYTHQQQWSKLDQILAQAEEAVPDDLTPNFQAGKTLCLEGHDYQRAERYLRKYLAHEPEGYAPSWAAAHWRLGQVLEKRGQKQEAMAELQAAVRLQPGLSGARDDLKRLRQ